MSKKTKQLSQNIDHAMRVVSAAFDENKITPEVFLGYLGKHKNAKAAIQNVERNELAKEPLPCRVL